MPIDNITKIRYNMVTRSNKTDLHNKATPTRAESLVEIFSQYTCERYRVVRGNSQEPAKAVKL